MVGYVNSLYIASLICVSFLSSSAEAGVYRWVDSQGEVQYSDVVPPSVAQQGHRELDNQGMTIKTVPAPPTPEEIAERKRKETLAKLLAEKENEQQQRDKYLLANYANVSELEAVFKSKLDLLEKNSQGMTERRNSLKTRMEAVKKQLDGLKDASQRKTLESYLSEAESTLVSYDHALEENQTEHESLTQHYEKDKLRLAELLNVSPSSPPLDPSKAPATPHEAPAHQ
jgi:hypothetical protein